MFLDTAEEDRQEARKELYKALDHLATIRSLQDTGLTRTEIRAIGVELLLVASPLIDDLGLDEEVGRLLEMQMSGDWESEAPNSSSPY